MVGILLGLASGFVNNMGLVFQKMAINKLPEGQKVTRRLLKNKLWLLGYIINGYLPLPFSVFALYFIGPALLPGLEGSGMIFLTMGSLKILRENLKLSEIVGILLVIVAIFSLAFSGLSVDITNYEYYLSSPDFFIRVILFSALVILGSIVLLVLRRTRKSRLGVLNAIDSGFMWVINNFWFALILAVVAHILLGTFVWTESLIFASAIPLLLSTQFLGVYRLQKSFEFGQAANMRPIQQTPIQIAPIFYFFALYLLPPPSELALPLSVTGIALLLTGMYLLSRRQAMLRAIK
nr:hypothetical protein [Candidatus Njordarchaeota archaeon]